jgi:excisionase family DNA binding protein
MSTPDRLISLSEAAARLGITYETLRRWAEKGLVQVVRVANRPLRIAESELRRLQTPYRDPP